MLFVFLATVFKIDEVTAVPAVLDYFSMSLCTTQLSF